MKNPLSLSLLAVALLSACGGSGGGDHTVAGENRPSDNNAATADNTAATQTTPAENAPSAPSAGESRANIMLSPVKLAPNRVAKPDSETQSLLDEAFALTNQLRSQAGVAPLTYNATLAAYAAVRAEESAYRFAHNRLNNDEAGDYDYFTRRGTIGENLVAGYSTPASAIDTLKNSAGHYRNMINGDFGQLGMGLYRINGHYYWAQIFTDPRTDSIYRFIEPLSRAEAANAIRNATAYHTDGTLQINGNLSSNTHLQCEGIYGNAYLITIKDGHNLVLRPYQSEGWSYQTFGEIIDDSRIPEAYVNVGNTYIPADDVTLRATYHGKSTGDLEQHSRVIADVRGELDFSADAKTLNLAFTNSRRGSYDLQKYQPPVYSADATLDFTDTLTWNGQLGRFESESGEARLYGPQAQELGGQFLRNLDNALYRGVYGAKRIDEN